MCIRKGQFILFTTDDTVPSSSSLENWDSSREDEASEAINNTQRLKSLKNKKHHQESESFSQDKSHMASMFESHLFLQKLYIQIADNSIQLFMFLHRVD